MRRTLTLATTTVVLLGSLTGLAATPAKDRAPAIEALLGAAPGTVEVATHRATGTVRLMTLSAPMAELGKGSVETQARRLFARHGAAFGVDAETDLVAGEAAVDRLGHHHVSFTQRYRGVPVWGVVIRAHGDREGRLSRVNGVIVPDIAPLSVEPTLAASSAEDLARSATAKERPQAGWPRLTAASEGLTVVRRGLARGLPGAAHLTWEVVVSDGELALERLFVDAHDGTIVERVPLVHTLTRLVYNVNFQSLIWAEGDPLPYDADTPAANNEINTIIEASKNTYDLFANLSGGEYLSWDGHGANMPSVYRAEFIDCPNAVATGSFTGFCPGLATDDVVAHEWVHNYTGATHGLIYQWQSGALNEAYSDIFGETVDHLNDIGRDEPNTVRSDGGCSIHGGSPPAGLEVQGPASVAGSYPVGGAQFNPPPPWSASGTVELVQASTGNPTEACGPLTGFTAGNVAIADRGNCYFVDKVANAAAAGAVAVIVVNHEDDGVIVMGGEGRQPIPALMVGRSHGEAIKAALGEGVTASLTQDEASDNSYRWLQAEDAGTIRDLWNPVCAGDPGKVSDTQYFCGESDGGGVHTNSGVPNHAYALLVDGGSYNGTSVAGIGFTRAAHIYWRAMSIYQVPTTDFVGHADALELSCQDLLGATLTDLATGEPSAETITAGHCTQLGNALEAVEMRSEPTQCGFLPLLAPDAPAVETTIELLSETFATDPVGRWTLTNQGAASGYTPRDWRWQSEAPEGADGGVMFATDRDADVGPVCGRDNESGLMSLTSPTVTVPGTAAEAVLLFDHYVATEAGWDGGNVKVSVNGGPFALVPISAFLHNRFNMALISASEQNTNPLAGQPAYTGTDGGSFEGSWGQTQVDLLRLASPGDTVQLRFDFGVDQCFGIDGWYLDDVRILARIPSPRRGGSRVGG